MLGSDCDCSPCLALVLAFCAAIIALIRSFRLCPALTSRLPQSKAAF